MLCLLPGTVNSFGLFWYFITHNKQGFFYMSDCEMIQTPLFTLTLTCLQLMYIFMDVCLVKLTILRRITQVLYEPIR